MRPRSPRILDTSAIVALFAAHRPILDLLDDAERGLRNVLLPTAAIADAEHELCVGPNGWEAVLLTPGLRSLPLVEHAAVEVGPWPGDLATRHAVHEADALHGAVVTRDPGRYAGHRVFLRVV